MTVAFPLPKGGWRYFRHWYRPMDRLHLRRALGVEMSNMSRAGLRPDKLAGQLREDKPVTLIEALILALFMKLIGDVNQRLVGIARRLERDCRDLGQRVTD